MSLVNSNNYIAIQGWMVTDLNLKGNELLVYAIIYGFSQDGVNKFEGSLQYLADWTNSSKQSIQKVLKSLVEKQLIIKEDYEINNVKFCKYYVVDGIQQSCMGIQQSCTNNIVNNIVNDDISKDISSSENSEPCELFSFGNTKKPKPNLYQKCLGLIYNYTDDDVLIQLLIDYLKVCLEMKSIKGVNQWKGLLNKLDNIHNNGGGSYGDIVHNSIEHGWKSFYAVSNTNYSDKNNINNITGMNNNKVYYESENHELSERSF